MTRTLIWALGLLVFLSGCGSLITLQSDLHQADKLYQEFSIVTPDSDENARYLVLQLSTIDKSGVLTAHSISSSNKTRFPSFFNLTEYIVIFEDSNLDFIYQTNEPSYLYQKTLLADDQFILTSKNRISDGIPALDGLLVTPYLEFEVKPERIGRIVEWNDPAFSHEAKEMGMWQPLQFVESDYVGIFFLEPYQDDKIPVLYIHGMGGSGRDFEQMIDALDRDKYQPWIINYPSAFSHTLLSHSIAGIMRQLHQEHDYQPIHIVAHSMGGVLTQRYLNVCSASNRCELVRSFTSIASPFGGVSSAEAGVKYSPVVMPSWRDLTPNGKAIQNLFSPQAQKNVPAHLLIFAYQKSPTTRGESGDGTILLSSQLRIESVNQAHSLYGVNEDHISVLHSSDVQNKTLTFWELIEEAELANR
ncbi:Alpha/beta hydrolase [Vibrio chagasii]|nr:Alpha/beta hydrolase [Vibrio chagasii]CAH6860988.1 Alpha/beta hydrolase [Vibrio chagasii]CAH7075024.1 Alpha/beta hydrolase [Vibrio chagasii]CAH7302907.1 Alpha/beta hydrolase [Vibrio chagasii]